MLAKIVAIDLFLKIDNIIAKSVWKIVKLYKVIR